MSSPRVLVRVRICKQDDPKLFVSVSLSDLAAASSEALRAIASTTTVTKKFSLDSDVNLDLELEAEECAESFRLYFAGFCPELNLAHVSDISNPAALGLDRVWARFKDATPLKRLYAHLGPRNSDSFFWINLSVEPQDIFETTLTDHLMRNGVLPTHTFPAMPYRVGRLILFTKQHETTKNTCFGLSHTYSVLSDRQPRRFFPNGGCFRPATDPLSVLSSDSIVRRLLQVPGVALCGGAPLRLIQDVNNVTDRHREQIFERSGDLDLFLFATSMADMKSAQSKKKYISTKVAQLLEEVKKINSVNVDIFISVNSISLNLRFKDDQRVFMRIQIIKRLYSSIDEILLGFDLDASASAIVSAPVPLGPSGPSGPLGLQLVVSRRFENAIRHGINVVNPFLQSQTFNHRLCKYVDRGFYPLVAGGVHLTKPALLKALQMETPDHKHHPQDALDIQRVGSGLSELMRCTILRTNKKLPKVPKMPSDYETKQYHTLFEEGLVSVAPHRAVGKNEYFGTRFRNYAWRRGLQPLVDMHLLDNWRTHLPGSQITGCFNPTNIDYYKE